METMIPGVQKPATKQGELPRGNEINNIARHILTTLGTVQFRHSFLDGVQVVALHSSDAFHSSDMTAIGCEHWHKTSVDIIMFDLAAFLILFGNP